MARKTVGIVGGILLLASAAMSQSGGGYDLTWSSIDAGGGIVSGGGYTLASSIGQPDASAPVSGGSWPSSSVRRPATP